jgi:hypothetical protein
MYQKSIQKTYHNIYGITAEVPNKKEFQHHKYLSVKQLINHDQHYVLCCSQLQCALTLHLLTQDKKKKTVFICISDVMLKLKASAILLPI